MDRLMRLHSDLSKSSKLIQKKIFKYFNQKKSEGPDFKEGDKVWLLHKNFKNRQLSKKLDYVKLGLFKVLKKVTEIIFKLDLLARMKIYLTHATLLKGGAALQNLRIPIFPSKTIDFPTFKTQFLLPSEPEMDLFGL